LSGSLAIWQEETVGY